MTGGEKSQISDNFYEKSNLPLKNVVKLSSMAKSCNRFKKECGKYCHLTATKLSQ